MREGWTRTKLGEVAETRLGKTLPRGSGADLDGLPYLRNVNVQWNRISFGDLNRMPFSDAEQIELSLRQGDILVCEGGEVGRLALVQDHLEGVYFQNALHRVRVVAEVVVPEYLALSLEHFVRSGGLEGLVTRVTIAHLNQAKLRSLPLFLPPLSEQRRIVDLIGAIDGAVKQGTEAATRLELLWWRLADDLRVGVSGLSVKLLGEIADIGGGLTKNKKDAERPDAVEAPYLRVANVLRRRLDLRDVAKITAPLHRIEAARLMPGDVLMNEGGDKDKLGRGAVWRGAVKDCTHQNHVFRVRVRDDRFSPEFLSAWANSFGQKWFETHGTQTTGIASINKTTLSRFPVPDIALSEQQRWAELLQVVTDQEDEYRAQTRRLQRLRSSLLDVLLSGEHEIPESYDELMGVAS